jgi:hypothetical protein
MVTYTPRPEAGLETAIEDYLEEGGGVLVVTGPSKCGKTVLLEHTVPDALWLDGGTIDSTDRFWRLIVDELGGFTGDSVALAEDEVDSEAIATQAGFSPVGVGAKRTRTETGTTGKSTTRTHQAERDVSSVARSLLREPDYLPRINGLG